jgi:hypothetical protein
MDVMDWIDKEAALHVHYIHADHSFFEEKREKMK